MKNYFIIALTALVSLFVGLVFGKYTSDCGRYILNYYSGTPVLLDSKTGNLYVFEKGKVQKVNYKEIFENTKQK